MKVQYASTQWPTGLYTRYFSHLFDFARWYRLRSCLSSSAKAFSIASACFVRQQDNVLPAYDRCFHVKQRHFPETDREGPLGACLAARAAFVFQASYNVKNSNTYDSHNNHNIRWTTAATIATNAILARCLLRHWLDSCRRNLLRVCSRWEVRGQRR